MKEKLQKFGLLTATLLVILPASAYDFEVDGICYDITSFTELTVSASSLSEKCNPKVIIPSYVEFQGKTLSVTEMCENFAKDNTLITSVFISSGIPAISANAFSGCINLQEIDMQYTEKICCNAFSGCISLKKVIFSRKITSIESMAFVNCNSLQTITLPNGLTEISESLFEGCTSLCNIEIPSGIISIGNKAFSGCSSLSEIVIPDKVEFVGSRAFSGCSSLTSCIIGANVATIEKDLFRDCISLQYLTFDQSEKPITLNDYFLVGWHDEYEEGIGGWSKYYYTYQSQLSKLPIKALKIHRPIITKHDYEEREYYSGDRHTWYKYYTYLPTFKENRTLEEISLSESVSDESFCGCANLTKVIFKNGVRNIGERAFANCQKLRVCDMSETIETIGDLAFWNCTLLDDITLPDAVNLIGDGCFRGCESIKEIQLPNNLNSVGSNAFQDCKSLRVLKIGSFVKNIGPCAFFGCDNLDSIISLQLAPSEISSNTFDNLHYYKSTLSVPTGATEAYKSNNLWSNFWNINEKDEFLGDFIVDGIVYQILSPETAIVRSAPRGYKGDVVVPSNVTYDSTTYEIVSIGQAFNGSAELHTVSIPPTINYIIGGAFANCTNLATMTIPSTIECVGDTAFAGCVSMESLRIEDGNSTLKLGTGRFDKEVYVGGWISSSTHNPTKGGYCVKYTHGLFYECPLKSLYIGRSLDYKHFDKYDLNSFGERWTPDNATSYQARYCEKFDAPFHGVNTLSNVTITSNVSVLGIPEFTVTDWKEPISVTPDIFKECNNILYVISENSQPPVGVNFSQTVYDNAPLFLPNGGEVSYREDDCWKQFNKITESTFVSIESIIFESENIEMGINSTKVLIPIVNPSYASITDLVWISSAPSIVEVSNTGVITSYSNEGAAVITAYTKDGSGLSASVYVSVKEVTGVEDIVANNTDSNISITPNGITFVGNCSERLMVYRIDGSLYRSEIMQPGQSISLPRGIYTILINNKAIKIKI